MLPICCQTAPRSARERLTPQVEGPVILDGIDEALEGALSAFTTDEVGDHTVGPLGGLADADSGVGVIDILGGERAGVLSSGSAKSVIVIGDRLNAASSSPRAFPIVSLP